MTKFKAYFDDALARQMAADFRAAWPGFPEEPFINQIVGQLAPLELKARVAVIAEAMRDHLPEAYPAALEIIHAVMPPELSTNTDDGVLAQAAMWPIAYFVEVYGLGHYDESMAAMPAITKRFSAEFAIRPYIERWPERTLATLQTWTQDENPHVRRLTSEGTRPRLPWASQLSAFIKDPTPTLPILEALRDDPSRYVQRSVANHLNDITKDHPSVTLRVLRGWQQDITPAREWITKHALRTMVKAGDTEALELLGYGAPQLRVEDVRITPEELVLGESFTLAFTLISESDAPQDLVVDMVLHLVRGNGSTNAKVFKLKNVTLGAEERLELSKEQPIKKVSTRRYYPGLHKVEVQVNGRVLAESAFALTNGG